MLYTGEQIAEMYSTEKVELKTSIVRKWSNKGLKHIRGPHNTFLYKKEWVEEFLEHEAVKNTARINLSNFNSNTKKTKRKISKVNYEECTII